MLSLALSRSAAFMKSSCHISDITKSPCMDLQILHKLQYYHSKQTITKSRCLSLYWSALLMHLVWINFMWIVNRQNCRTKNSIRMYPADLWTNSLMNKDELRSWITLFVQNMLKLYIQNSTEENDMKVDHLTSADGSEYMQLISDGTVFR